MRGQERLIIGISGASGIAYGVRALQLLRNTGIETHLVMSRTAEVTSAYESALKVAEIKSLAHTAYAIDDMAAAIASGSFATMGMIVAPCSIRSMAEIATGVTTTLLTRAADVTLKERRRLVPHGARDATPYRPPALHDSAVRNGGDHRAARPGLLRKA